MNQAPVQRITVIVAHADGSQSTFYCEEPVLPELEMVTPLNPLPVRGGLEDLVPYAIAGPDLSRMRVEFKAHPRHGIITEHVSQPLPDVIWAFRKATGWSFQQALEYAAAVDGLVPRYPPLDAGASAAVTIPKPEGD